MDFWTYHHKIEETTQYLWDKIQVVQEDVLGLTDGIFEKIRNEVYGSVWHHEKIRSSFNVDRNRFLKQLVCSRRVSNQMGLSSRVISLPMSFSSRVEVFDGSK